MLELLRDLCDRGAYDGNFSFPKDFNPLEYLFLNPDVVRAGCNAWDHFAKFGVTEKRPYSGAALWMPDTGRGGR